MHRRSSVVLAAGLLVLGAAPAALAQCLSSRGGISSDFKPPAQVLFETDFSDDPLGTFPKNLELKAGSLEVIEWEGRRALKASAVSAFAIPSRAPLPQQFTLELGVVHRATKQVGAFTVEIYGGRNFDPMGTADTHVSIGPNGWWITGGGGSAPPARFDEDCTGRKSDVRIAVDGHALTLYVDERRLAHVPNAKFTRSGGIVIQVEARDDGGNAVFITSIKLSGAPSTAAAAPGARVQPEPAAARMTAAPGVDASGAVQAQANAQRNATIGNQISGTDTVPSPPALPATDMKAIAGFGNVQLVWRRAPGAVGYRIARRRVDDNEWVTLTGDLVTPEGVGLFGDTVYFDRSATPNRQYVYFLMTYYRNGAGAYYFPPAASEQRVTATPKDGTAHGWLPADWQTAPKVLSVNIVKGKREGMYLAPGDHRFFHYDTISIALQPKGGSVAWVLYRDPRPGYHDASGAFSCNPYWPTISPTALVDQPRNTLINANSFKRTIQYEPGTPKDKDGNIAHERVHKGLCYAIYAVYPDKLDENGNPVMSPGLWDYTYEPVGNYAPVRFHDRKWGIVSDPVYVMYSYDSETWTVVPPSKRSTPPNQ